MKITEPRTHPTDILTYKKALGYDLHNDLNEKEAHNMVDANDGSLYLYQQAAVARWMLTWAACAHFSLFLVDSISSYRAKLEGIELALKHIQYHIMPPGEVI